MNKLGINLWNWAPGLSDACCGLPTKAAEMGFTALELPMTQPTISPTLRDEVRGSGWRFRCAPPWGQGAIFRALTPMCAPPPCNT